MAAPVYIDSFFSNHSGKILGVSALFVALEIIGLLGYYQVLSMARPVTYSLICCSVFVWGILCCFKTKQAEVAVDQPMEIDPALLALIAKKFDPSKIVNGLNPEKEVDNLNKNIRKLIINFLNLEELSKIVLSCKSWRLIALDELVGIGNLFNKFPRIPKEIVTVARLIKFERFEKTPFYRTNNIDFGDFTKRSLKQSLMFGTMDGVSGITVYTLFLRLKKGDKSVSLHLAYKQHNGSVRFFCRPKPVDIQGRGKVVGMCINNHGSVVVKYEPSFELDLDGLYRESIDPRGVIGKIPKPYEVAAIIRGDSDLGKLAFLSS